MTAPQTVRIYHGTRTDDPERIRQHGIWPTNDFEAKARMLVASYGKDLETLRPKWVARTIGWETDTRKQQGPVVHLTFSKTNAGDYAQCRQGGEFADQICGLIEKHVLRRKKASPKAGRPHVVSIDLPLQQLGCRTLRTLLWFWKESEMLERGPLDVQVAYIQPEWVANIEEVEEGHSWNKGASE